MIPRLVQRFLLSLVGVVVIVTGLSVFTNTLATTLVSCPLLAIADYLSIQAVTSDQ